MKLLLSWGLILLIGFTDPVDKNYLLGKINPSEDPRFVKLDDHYSSGAARGGFLRKETYDAFVKMATAAKKDNITITIISATRNFESQKNIWENKWNGRVLVEGKNLTTIINEVERAKIILRFSSMPGSSRHHWGTDFDLNSLENNYFEQGEGLRIYRWLTMHATEFGFCQPYTSKENDRTGYQEEKWHWSYRPLADKFLEQYLKNITERDLTGFDGSATATEIAIVKNYVGGVACFKEQ